MLCPCGSSKLFHDCCQLYIVEELNPSTAQELMRSRFSAYATGNAQYIVNTYALIEKEKQSINDIEAWADECTWIALKIHESLTNIVEFSAYYIADNKLCELRERSNFILEEDKWRYIDGNIKVNSELGNIKRNETCPCNNYPTSWSLKKNKKYKHCCAK